MQTSLVRSRAGNGRNALPAAKIIELIVARAAKKLLALCVCGDYVFAIELVQR